MSQREFEISYSKSKEYITLSIIDKNDFRYSTNILLSDWINDDIDSLYDFVSDDQSSSKLIENNILTLKSLIKFLKFNKTYTLECADNNVELKTDIISIINKKISGMIFPTKFIMPITVYIPNTTIYCNANTYSISSSLKNQIRTVSSDTVFVLWNDIVEWFTKYRIIPNKLMNLKFPYYQFNGSTPIRIDYLIVSNIKINDLYLCILCYENTTNYSVLTSIKDTKDSYHKYIAVNNNYITDITNYLTQSSVNFVCNVEWLPENMFV